MDSYGWAFRPLGLVDFFITLVESIVLLGLIPVVSSDTNC